jgi:methionyl-tRNA synthetase
MMHLCARPSRATYAQPGDLEGDGGGGDLYLDRYEGWYSVRDEAFYDDSELIDGEGGEKIVAAGHAGRMDREENLVLPPVQYQEPLLDSIATIPTSSAGKPPQRGVRFVEGGLKDLSVSRTSFDWGVPVPGRRPRHVRLGRRADHLHDRVGYPDESGVWRATGRPTST